MHIPHYLLEAYVGYFEEDREMFQRYEAHKDQRKALGLAALTYDDWRIEYCRAIILEHTPRQRLNIYLEWNGILGFASQIWTICESGRLGSSQG